MTSSVRQWDFVLDPCAPTNMGTQHKSEADLVKALLGEVARPNTSALKTEILLAAEEIFFDVLHPVYATHMDPLDPKYNAAIDMYWDRMELRVPGLLLAYYALNDAELEVVQKWIVHRFRELKEWGIAVPMYFFKLERYMRFFLERSNKAVHTVS